MPKYLDPKSDVVFKKIFGHNKHLLMSFLNAILPLPEDRLIQDLIYLPPEQVPTLPAMKYTIVDVKCTDTQGRTFIVEMQIQWVTAFLQRMLFNTSAAYVHQLKKGDAYRELSPVYGLALLAHNFIEDDTEWFHHYKMANVNKKTTDNLEDIQLVIVELPKFKPSTMKEKRLTALWLRFLSEINEETREVSPELLLVPEIKEAIHLTEESAYTQGELATYNAYWDSVSTEKTLHLGLVDRGLAEGFAEGMQKGVVQGKMEGKLEGKLEIATQLLAGGMSIEQVAAITQLSIEEIQKVR